MYRVIIFFFLFVVPFRLMGQRLETTSLEAFRQMNKEKRLELCLNMDARPWDSSDSIFYHHQIEKFLQVCRIQQDKKCRLLLLYRLLNIRGSMKFSPEQEEALYNRCIWESQKYRAPLEELVFTHYKQLFLFNKKKEKMEVCYLYLLDEYQKMKSIGLEKFKTYETSRLLHHSGNFFLQLEDYDIALEMLLEAEKYLDELTTHKNITVHILNAIQNIYQQKNNDLKGIEYAQKILDHVDKMRAKDERFYSLWEGLTLIDMAAMKLNLHKIKESEELALKGYQIIGGQPSDYELGSLAEVDALNVLVDIKIKLKKYDEANLLVKRAAELYHHYADLDIAYFKRIKLYQNQIHLAEIRKDYKKAIEVQKLLDPALDSLERKNDIRKFESLKQKQKLDQLRNELALAEKEKQLNTWIRNASLLLLLLSGALFFTLYNSVKSTKKSREAELENARHELGVISRNLLEKSDLLEQMKAELNMTTNETEKNAYLDKLGNYSILKDEDWHEFKMLFEKVHPNFINEIKNQYEDITPAEIRLLVLEKLNFSQEAMANNLGVSKQAIYQTKYRLRKKYGDLI